MLYTLYITETAERTYVRSATFINFYSVNHLYYSFLYPVCKQAFWKYNKKSVNLDKYMHLLTLIVIFFKYATFQEVPSMTSTFVTLDTGQSYMIST